MKNFTHFSLPKVNIRKNLSKIIFASSLLIANSCADDDMSSKKVEYIEDTKIEGPVTIEKLLENGWEILQDNDLSDFDDSIDNLNEKRPINAQSTPLTREHLKDIGYDTSTFSGRLKLMNDLTINGMAPVGVRFNQSFATGIGHQLNFTQMANVNIKIGKPVIKILENGVLLPSEYSNVFRFTNPDNAQKIDQFNYTISKTRKTSKTVTVTASVKVGGNINLSIPAIEGIKGGVNLDFTLGGSLSLTDTKESTERFEMENKIIVPPRSRRDILVITTKNSSLINYSVPVTFTGNVQTNFAIPVNWSLFHNIPITNYPNFARNTKAEEGLVSINKVNRITVLIRKPVRLNN
ncbi:hypothetical protein SAMN05443634_102276 [Chishuiella changwenlii]|uniref:Toxin ETX/toxin MTX2 n=1 Tax=Chishuiella changwenlii TaxID=1434701 RepID=A0A1M6U9X5_9FLAO|nr:hypothetical protein [Chishuiella changwenlii]GGE99442.1 hypothetical protein GCM10010984_16280 [Chishuiella changwenlii]SHK65959.1 hypothetical protein SAMN05443634_102276 [Chishuiella changwenlii]